jgi:hypothetical protein
MSQRAALAVSGLSGCILAIAARTMAVVRVSVFQFQ